jgi:hypothetical protein
MKARSQRIIRFPRCEAVDSCIIEVVLPRSHGVAPILANGCPGAQNTRMAAGDF